MYQVLTAYVLGQISNFTICQFCLQQHFEALSSFDQRNTRKVLQESHYPKFTYRLSHIILSLLDTSHSYAFDKLPQ